MSNGRRLPRVLLPLVVITVAAVGCGVPTDDSPQAVGEDDLPASLRPGAETTPTTDVGRQEFVSVFLIRDDELTQVVDTVKTPADLGAVLALLERGPTDAQAEAGLRSAFTGVDVVRRVSVNNGTAAIDLDPSFADTPSRDQILAIGQLVLTATARPGISRVRLTVDGESTQVPRANGSLTTKLLTKSDYSSLLAA
jgi:spore germination protein GerM